MGTYREVGQGPIQWCRLRNRPSPCPIARQIGPVRGVRLYLTETASASTKGPLRPATAAVVRLGIHARIQRSTPRNRCN
jgi:hypothetical protein